MPNNNCAYSKCYLEPEHSVAVFVVDCSVMFVTLFNVFYLCSFYIGVGDFSVWEFSGNPTYYCSYDYFAANDPTSIHVVVFSLEEPYEVQLNQVIFWLNFLKSLVPAEEPIGMPILIHFYLLYI